MKSLHITRINPMKNYTSSREKILESAPAEPKQKHSTTEITKVRDLYPGNETFTNQNKVCPTAKQKRDAFYYNL